MGFPGCARGKKPSCQCRRRKRCWFDPWVGKIPWRRTWQLTPLFLPGESHGQRSLVGYSPWGLSKSHTQLKWLNMHPVRESILVWFQMLVERLSAFHVVCEFVINGVCYVRSVPSIPTLVKVFIMNGSWILSSSFLHLLRWSCSFCLLLWWCITLVRIYWTILVNFRWI